MEMKTGGLRSLLVVPNEGISAHSVGFDTDEAGRLKIPISTVQAVKDYIVVTR